MGWWILSRRWGCRGCFDGEEEDDGSEGGSGSDYV